MAGFYLRSPRSLWEIGYFYAGKSPEQRIIGARTDFRRAGESEGAGVNAMIEGACGQIERSREALSTHQHVVQSAVQWELRKEQ